MMFRPGTKNGHAVYWSDPDEPTDRFVGMAMTPDAAQAQADGLNLLYAQGRPPFVDGLPAVPKREPTS